MCGGEQIGPGGRVLDVQESPAAGAGQGRRDREEAMAQGFGFPPSGPVIGEREQAHPGEQIVREAHERGIKVVPIPAASACVTALAASGQPTARFVFEGFLPVPKRDRRERLAFLQNETRTMIFYEAPHKLRGTLDDLAAAFGAGRSVSLCRELTKLHEEIKKTTLGEAVAYYKENDPRGEYVLVLAGADPAAVEQAAAPTLEEAVAAARALQANGLPPAAAAKQAAAGTPFSKGEIYKQLIQ